MHQAQLSASQMATMRNLLRQEPVPGQPVPEQRTFELLAALVPCDVIGVGLTDLDGHSLGGLEVSCDGLRRSTKVPIAPQPCLGDDEHGPHYLGYMHWNEHPREAEECGIDVTGDSIAIGFRNGTDNIAQYYFHRSTGQFSADELALLWMLGPVLQRLVRERPTPQLPYSLTVTERRILCHVAAGLNNREIAESFHIATGTVRKHLENAYRKLGVTSRLAAVARLQGADISSLDLRERIDRYA
jgi:DNA-binding CsgD family transcriptional regulator